MHRRMTRRVLRGFGGRLGRGSRRCPRVTVPVVAVRWPDGVVPVQGERNRMVRPPPEQFTELTIFDGPA